MPNRILRDGIITSAKMAKLGWAAEVLYRRLMSVADDFGRYYADPGIVRGYLYPRQLNKVSDADIGKWLDEVQAAGLVSVYPASDGERYLVIVNFGQQVRAQKSKFPNPPADASNCAQGLEDAHLDVSGDEGVDEKEAKASSSAASPPPAAPSIPDCPHLKLLALFAEKVPELPQPKPELWDGKKADALRQRWKWLLTTKRTSGEHAGERYAETEAQGLDWFGRFFDFVRASDFLTGRDGAWSGCSLDWLVTKDNFSKVVQGNYKNKETA